MNYAFTAYEVSIVVLVPAGPRASAVTWYLQLPGKGGPTGTSYRGTSTRYNTVLRDAR